MIGLVAGGTAEPSGSNGVVLRLETVRETQLETARFKSNSFGDLAIRGGNVTCSVGRRWAKTKEASWRV